MPIYEYRCTKCGHLLDALQKLSEPPLERCPACAQDTLQRMVSAPRFRLKGSGWYETDFKKDNRRNLADGGDKPADAKPASEGTEKKADKEKKTDKKEPAAATSAKPAPNND